MTSKQIKIYAGEETARQWDEICGMFTSNTAAFAVIVADYFRKITENNGYKKIEGEHIVIELHRQNDVLAYVIRGQGISEDAGTSRLPESELLEVLLSPIGLKSDGVKIFSAY